ncbi:MAG: hypothetical protein HY040_08140 [Planctomycetes bacterium]|nr:hypothetical protein [Planctomycetota bacterium]
MRRIEFALAALSVISLLPHSISACSLCGNARKSAFSREWDRHPLIVYGYPANPRLSTEPGALPGAGATDFHIEKVLKPNPALGKREVVEVKGYIPVVNDTRFVAFFNVVEGKLQLDVARSVKSKAMADYLEGAQAYKDKSRMEALLYYARFLDHPDDQVAEDAFLEFAGSTDQEVGEATKRLTPERFRTLLKNPKLEAERMSLFAFLLGSCGGPKDADFLKSMIDGPGPEVGRALDGIVGGYIALRPREGWDLAGRLLADPKRPFHHRHALVRMVRFYHGWKPQECQKEILRCYQAIIPDGELADFAIEDLRQWKSWDLTPTILAQFTKKSHNAPITHRSIVRYALSCPQPEAREFVERVRRQEAVLVRELEDDLAFEAGK